MTSEIELAYIQEMQTVQKRFKVIARITSKTRDAVSFLRAQRLLDSSLTEITIRYNKLSIQNSSD